MVSPFGPLQLNFVSRRWTRPDGSNEYGFDTGGIMDKERRSG